MRSSLVISAAAFAALASACRAPNDVAADLAVIVGLAGAPVVLNDDNLGAHFKLPIKVQNDSDQEIQVGCWRSLSKLLDGSWQTVWERNCTPIQGPWPGIAAHSVWQDTIVVSSAKGGIQPTLPAGSLAGEYKVHLLLQTSERKLLPASRRSSEPFRLP